TEAPAVHRAIHRQFTALFHDEETDANAQAELLATAHGRVPPRIAGALDAPVTVAEVQQALRCKAAWSAPGVDGIGYALYKRLAGVVAPVLAGLFNLCLANSIVPRSWRAGHVVLLPKRADGPQRPDTLRPIALLGAD